jgi:hypothetical protein
MATLILTAVGSAVGGPVGGAIGALIGRSVDARVFKTAAREGPRLSDLAVQTSSYGTQIPKLFGTIRVAGTVIWATDLIETRATSGGSKGQPSTATYSYSANFAVLLSARAIQGIGRIWAEGKLLRGAAGDWKTTTDFRLHLGGEDQPADPLIASADPTTPAYRGCAYAVFEGLQLADFGNRIPSLTFEVIADTGSVSAGAIAETLAAEVDARVGQMLVGYAASGDSVAGVLDSLATLSGGWWSPSGRRIRLRDTADDAVTLSDDGVGPGARQVRRIAAIDSVPRTLSVAHHDPARDYQIGVQQAVRPGAGSRAERIELPAVMSADTARHLADRALVTAEAMRTKRSLSVGMAAIGLTPGTPVVIAGEAGLWRAQSVAIDGYVTRVVLVPVRNAPVAMATTSGRVLAAPDHRVGKTLLFAAEHPPIDDAALTMPRISVMATGLEPGWRGAALLYSLDDGDSWASAGALALPSILGGVEEPPGVGAVTLEDRCHAVVVLLARDDMTLEDADAAGLAQGRNVAIVGEEMIQFGRAEPLGGRRWRLSDLRRGVRGTEWAMTRHREGEAFALVDRDAVVTIDVPVDAIGRTMRLMATGVGDIDGPAAAIATVSGTSVLPPSPVRLAMTVVRGERVVSWTRRSRLGWTWIEGVEAPLVEERERYAVLVTDAAGGSDYRETTEASLVLEAFARDGERITVRQIGTYGAGQGATITNEGGGQ